MHHQYRKTRVCLCVMDFSDFQKYFQHIFFAVDLKKNIFSSKKFKNRRGPSPGPKTSPPMTAPARLPARAPKPGGTPTGVGLAKYIRYKNQDLNRSYDTGSIARMYGVHMCA